MPEFEFLGPYRIGKPIGRGGMGTVYAAVHEKTHEKVAVKLISAHVSDEIRFRDRFQDEAKALEQLKHKNIVRVLGFGEHQGQMFYSMELAEGKTLQAHIRRQKKLPWLSALNIAIEVCSALKHAHDLGIIHRDLKPANLIVTADDQIKLVDFGIAKMFGGNNQTLAGSILGTADYMAPEQATGGPITPRTDLYALGCVMYAMLTGRPPFRGKNVTEVIESLKRDRPVPLDMVDPNLPSAIVELVHQLLEKEPTERPPTALAVMNRLKAMRAGLKKQETLSRRSLATDLDESDQVPSSHSDGAPTNIRGASKPMSADERQAISESVTLATDDSDPNLNESLDLEDSDGEQSSDSRTHFRTVNESDGQSGFFSAQPVETDSTWRNRLSIAALIGMLAVAASLIVYATRPPSADQLYRSATEMDDIGAMTSFVNRFPNDSRYAEVLNLKMQHMLRGQMKRMETQRKLGVTPLSAFEEAFYSAIEDRHRKPQESAEKLEQWLTVYDSPESELSDNLSRLIELAKYEREALRHRGPKIIVDPRAQEMITEIRSLAAHLNHKQARKKLTGFVETFAEFDWAGPAVAEAQRQLETLDEFASGDDAESRDKNE